MRVLFLLCFFSLIPNTSFADANEDCTELAAMPRFKVDPQDVAQFKQACVQFEKRCYEGEKAWADNCGIRGAAEQGALARLNASTAAIGKGEASYSISGGQGIKVCSDAATARETQKTDCSNSARECRKMGTQVRLAHSPPVSLACTLFTAESPKWSPYAAKAKNLCDSIEAEITRIEDDAAAARKACGKIAESVRGAADIQSGEQSVNDRIKMNAPDAKACGLFGCAQNEDGTYSPKMAPAAAPEPERPNPNTDVGPAPEANTSIRLPNEDRRACGLFGCVQNSDGTFSPKYAPSR